MKKIILTTGFFVYAFILFGQVTETESNLKSVKTDTLEGWKKGGVININTSQTSLTNWSAGGQSSMSVNGLLSIFANYKKGKGLLENTLDIGYGTIKQKGNENWWKTDDKLDFTSKYGQKASKNWYYAALLNIKTQLADGYNYPNDSVPISGFFFPGYILGALGMDYKPNDDFSVFIAPLTSKMTIVSDKTLSDAGAFGVNPGEKIYTALGGYIRIFYKRDIMENISFQTKLDLFSNYLKNPQNIDVSWETLISMKVNKYISATLSTQLLYDDDINIAVDNNNDDVPDKFGPRIQFKEVLAAGFSYKF